MFGSVVLSLVYGSKVNVARERSCDADNASAGMLTIMYMSIRIKRMTVAVSCDRGDFFIKAMVLAVLVDRHELLGMVLRFCRVVELQRLREAAARWQSCCDDRLPMGICAWREIVTHGAIGNMRRQYTVEKQDELLTARIQELVQSLHRETLHRPIWIDTSRTPCENYSLMWLHTTRVRCSACGDLRDASKWRIIATGSGKRRISYVCAACLLNTKERDFPCVRVVRKGL